MSELVALVDPYWQADHEHRGVFVSNVKKTEVAGKQQIVRYNREMRFWHYSTAGHIDLLVSTSWSIIEKKHVRCTVQYFYCCCSYTLELTGAERTMAEIHAFD